MTETSPNPDASIPPVAPGENSNSRPGMTPMRLALVGLAVMVIGGTVWWIARPKPEAAPVNEAPIEFTAGSDESQMRVQLEEKLGEIAMSVFGNPFKVITADNVTQIEKLSKPYPEATFNPKASSYQESEADGQVYRLIYDTKAEPKAILEWYQKEWSPEYLTIHEHKSGLAGYTIEIRVPGLQVERDILIVAIPDKITQVPSTQIWVTVKNTGVTNQDSA